MRQGPRKQLIRKLLILGVIVLTLLGGASWWWVRASLPQLDGQITVSGLRAPVEVLFDGHGVPHVYASGAEDAWFTAGLMHARDRLWQMELYRRAARGRLSEILGERTLPIDRRFISLDLAGAAEAEWKAAPGPVRDALTRYAAGVNAHIARAAGWRRPLEFQLLGVTPAPWTPIDSLAVGRLLAWRLAENHQAELVRHALGARFGVTEALRLGGRYPAGAPSVVQGPATDGPPSPAAPAPPAGNEGPVAPTGNAAPAAPAGPPGPAAPAGNGSPSTKPPSPPAANVARSPVAWPTGLEWLHPNARRGGSNNWVVSGKRTVNGRPLLANDPHLQMEFPNIWYEMHLVAAGLDAIGVTVPGTPFVILGHNARVAWGMTNTGADVQDLFIDRLDLARKRYFFQGEWRPVDVTRKLIPVKGGVTESFELWKTRHGTVFADVGLEWEEPPSWLWTPDEQRGERRVFSMRWDAAGGEMAGAFEALNRAGSWSEFTAAVERFAAPSQNFVYADVEGNIGYAMSGVLPQRPGSVGVLPNNGETGEGEWVGSIPSAALPRLFNPPRGYVASSNNLVDRQWPGLVTRDWAAPFRALRLHHVIEAVERIDLVTAASWQNDVSGLLATHLLGYSGSALKLAKSQNKTAAIQVLSELAAWDRRIDEGRSVTLFHLFEDALWRRTFFDEMGEPLFSRFYEWAGAERPAGLYVVLDEADSPWFDDIATIDRRETRDDILVLAAEDAATRAATDFATRRAWSEAHLAHFQHPLGSAAAPLRWLFNRGPVSVSGDSYTVNRTSYHRLRPFDVWEIPSWRQLFDVGQWDESRVVLPAGQSGHPLSRHYFDQNEMWRAGQYRVQPYSRQAVNAAQAHRLLMVP
jgi:penicillin amidase